MLSTVCLADCNAGVTELSRREIRSFAVLRGITASDSVAVL